MNLNIVLHHQLFILVMSRLKMERLMFRGARVMVNFFGKSKP